MRNVIKKWQGEWNAADKCTRNNGADQSRDQGKRLHRGYAQFS